MRVVIQRVAEASVCIQDRVHASIGPGLLVLLAVEPSDTGDDAEWLVGKIARLRVFNDAEGVMNLSVQEAQGEVLVVSQFTLLASTKKGNRPSYSRSAPPDFAIPAYENAVARLAEILGHPIKTGVFGADMKVSLVNDGPVTIIIDSKLRE